jgi:hypothetical protein
MKGFGKGKNDPTGQESFMLNDANHLSVKSKI